MSSRSVPKYLNTLAQFASGADITSLSAAARERARWIIADCIPVIAAGMQQREMKAFAASHLACSGTGNAWVIGAGRRANAFDAALINGTAGTWLELDEGNLFAKGHPGIQVVPAAVALAQEAQPLPREQAPGGPDQPARQARARGGRGGVGVHRPLSPSSAVAPGGPVRRCP
ncbi:MAG: MmgE/PrpD family protein, partial [Pseudomonadota bacterium]